MCAKFLYYLHFNRINIDGDCPIWGGRVRAQTHTAFKITSGETWRQRSGDFYHIWDDDKLLSIKNDLNKIRASSQKEALKHENESGDGSDGNFRISPLVSDPATWKGRMNELKIVKTKDPLVVLEPRVRQMAFALMNANVRAE